MIGWGRLGVRCLWRVAGMCSSDSGEARGGGMTDLEKRNDMLVPHENSYLLWQMLANSDAYLHLYPDSGHGFLNEYHQHFAGMVNAFLDEPEREDEDWF
jgi:hypothetical protein